MNSAKDQEIPRAIIDAIVTTTLAQFGPEALKGILERAIQKSTSEIEEHVASKYVWDSQNKISEKISSLYQATETIKDYHERMFASGVVDDARRGASAGAGSIVGTLCYCLEYAPTEFDIIFTHHNLAQVVEEILLKSETFRNEVQHFKELDKKGYDVTKAYGMGAELLMVFVQEIKRVFEELKTSSPDFVNIEKIIGKMMIHMHM